MAFTKEQFESINGFTSVFFGWGGEDDDAYIRFGGLSFFKSLHSDCGRRF